MLTLRNDEITLKGARNALLPTLDVLRILRLQRIGRRRRARIASTFINGCYCPHRARFRPSAMERRFRICFNSSAPDKGVGFNLNIPIAQPLRAVGAGALADGVPPGGAAAGAALHADSHAGGERSSLR